MFIHLECTTVRSCRSCCRGPKMPNSGVTIHRQNCLSSPSSPHYTCYRILHGWLQVRKKTPQHIKGNLIKSNRQTFSPSCRLFLGPLPPVMPIPRDVDPAWSHLRRDRLHLVFPKTVLVKNIASVGMDALTNQLCFLQQKHLSCMDYLMQMNPGWGLRHSSQAPATARGA